MIDELKDLIKKRIKKYPYLWNPLKFLKDRGMYIYKLFNKHKWESNSNKFDYILNEYADRVNDFFFIQIGANDGIMSDPLHEKIIKYKWSGILVEPQKKEFENLKKNYRGMENLIFENIAISDKDEVRNLYKLGEDKLKEDWQKGLATFFPKKTPLSNVREEDIVIEAVDCITMVNLLKKHKVTKIDLLQIDVEGYDYEIIKLIDFKKIKPKIIEYEHINLKIKEKSECKKYLQKIGYSIIEKEFDTVAILNSEFN